MITKESNGLMTEEEAKQEWGGVPGAENPTEEPKPEPKAEEPPTEPPAAEPPAEEPKEEDPKAEEPKNEDPKPEESEVIEANADEEEPKAEVDPEKKVEPKADDSFRAELENKIRQLTDGKTTSVDDFLQEVGQLREAANKKPTVTAETIEAYDAKLREEKGYGLLDALRWKEKDVEKMSDQEKMQYHFRINNPTKPNGWVEFQMEKFDVLNKTKEELAEMVEEEKITPQQLRELQVERDTILHESVEMLKKHKEGFDLNINFEAEEAAKASSPQATQEQIEAARRDLSKALDGFTTESVEVDLPMNMGPVKLQYSFKEDQKSESWKSFNQDWIKSRYYDEEGKPNHALMVQDRVRTQHFDSIVKSMVKAGVAAAIKKYEASRDNIQRDKDKPERVAEKNTAPSELDLQFKQRYGG